MQQTGTGVNTIHPTLRASLSGTFLQTLPDLVTVRHKLQAVVYDIFPSTTAVFSYAIGSRKLSANEQFFVGAQTSKFVTNNSNHITRLFYN